jgi:hypothetical protein
MLGLSLLEAESHGGKRDQSKKRASQNYEVE